MKTLKTSYLDKKGQLKYITLSENELKLIAIASKNGAITHANIRSSVGEKRLRKLQEAAIFKREDPYRNLVDGKYVNRYAYSLTDKSTNIAKEMGYCLIAQGYNGYKHTEILEKKIMKLLETYNIEELLNEKEQADTFKYEIAKYKKLNPNNKLSINDIAYYNKENRLISVEVATKNYRRNDLIKHKNYASAISAEYLLERE